MSSPLHFLAELGLVDEGQPLDERALRRAYARRLKQIDIEVDPQAFQQLREALEIALRWSAARERAQEAEAATAPGPAPAASPEADAAPDAPRVATPESIGAEAFARFKEHVDAVFRDESAAHSALAHALREERLINIDARTFFEWSVARLLAEGWRPGHEHLLDPAIEAFGWNSEHARLSNFGQVGALLAAAIHERGMTQAFTPAQRAAIAPLLERLRADAPPDPATLRDDVDALQFLVQRVPSWLRVVTPVAPVNARFKMWSERPESRLAPAPAQSIPKLPGKKPTSDAAVVGIVLIIVVTLLSQLGDKTSRSPTPASQSQPVDVDAASTQDLQERQRQAEEMLAAIRQAPAASQASRAAHKPRQAASMAPFQLPGRTATDAEPAWWQPPWARSDPDSTH